jgi:hypothetical protein
MEIFIFYKMRKKGGNKKRVVYTRGGEVFVVMHSAEVWEHPWAQALKCPSLRRRMHSYRNLPYNKI